jgi:hypothetical protein
MNWHQWSQNLKRWDKMANSGTGGKTILKWIWKEIRLLGCRVDLSGSKKRIQWRTLVNTNYYLRVPYNTGARGSVAG